MKFTHVYFFTKAKNVKETGRFDDAVEKGDKDELNGEEEVRASSTAANLFAALAAEALEDETDFDVSNEPQPQPQTVVVPHGQVIILFFFSFFLTIYFGLRKIM